MYRGICNDSIDNRGRWRANAHHEPGTSACWDRARSSDLGRRRTHPTGTRRVSSSSPPTPFGFCRRACLALVMVATFRTEGIAQFSNGLLLVEFVNEARIDESLYPFLLRDPTEVLRPRFRFGLRVTFADGSDLVYRLTSGTPGIVQAPFQPNDFPDILGPDLFPIHFPCENVRRVEIDSTIDVFLPVRLYGYEFVEPQGDGGQVFHRYELRDTTPPNFHRLEVDDVDVDGNVLMLRNVGVRDLPAPVVNPLCGTTIVFRVDGTLDAPTLATVEQQPAYDRDDLAAVARLGGRYAFRVTIDAFDATSGACCSSAGCALLSPDHCSFVSGTFLGAGTDCTVPACYGACCNTPASVSNSSDTSPLAVGFDCEDTLQVFCEASHGQFNGVGSRCTDVSCADGACCFDGKCVSTSQALCESGGGRFKGVGTECEYPLCTGACCDPFNGGCYEDGSASCELSNRSYLGDGTTCDGSPCVGACCSGLDSCSHYGPVGCTVLFGGNFQGLGTTCEDLDIDCPPTTGACCTGDECFDETAAECANHQGTFLGITNYCYEACCNPAELTGACCLPSGACINACATPCAEAGGQFRGVGTSCAAQLCTGACCDESTAECSHRSEGVCNALGRVFRGLDTRCEDTVCGGTCCYSSGNCSPATLAQCNDGPGVFMGTDIPCAQVVCPVGACCDDGDCYSAVKPFCEALGGTFRGVGSTCDQVACQFGACCAGGGCYSDRTPEQCDALGGVHLGEGSDCNGCDGACCSQGECYQSSPSGCGGGGGFHGFGTTCANVDCVFGTCCHPVGGCYEGVTPEFCDQIDGAFAGSGSTCSDCYGACCTNGGCDVTTPDDCTSNGFGFQGLGTDCNTAACFGACCRPVSSAAECAFGESSGQAAGGFLNFACGHTTASGCSASGGRFTELGTQCSTQTGLCCLDYGCLQDVCELECLSAGGRFHGVGSDCANETYAGLCSGACCVFSDQCVDGATECACDVLLGGVFQGDGSRCSDANTACQAPTGACCVRSAAFGFGSCVETSAFACAFQGLGLFGYHYFGDGTTCDAIDCTAGCPGDGHCCGPHRSLGCNDVDCCEAVCSVDPWCCFVSWWDEVCVQEARELCGEDCNDNGVADMCDLFDRQSQDCDRDGVPDDCEPDCDGDGLPDRCELDACAPGTPDCDDCNLNGRPDSCDLAGPSPVSLDFDKNGIPDECVSPTVTGVWSDDIWGLAGANPYPDNEQGVPDQSVTVLGSALQLDVTATIESLRLLNGATLDVTGSTTAGAMNPDLTIAGPGDLLIQGVAFGSQETLASLRVSDSRRVTVEGGTMTIDTAGIYQAMDDLDAGNSAALRAGSLVVRGRCPDFHPGKLELTGHMSAETVGDLIVDGATDLGPDCDCVNAVAGVTIAGGKTPPVVRGGKKTRIVVGGDLVLRGHALLKLEDGAALVLSGDFDNQVRCRTRTSFLSDVVFRGVGRSQLLEVATPDLGRTLDGLRGDFAMRMLVATGDTDVRLVNDVNNTPDGRGPREGQYVDRLVVEDGASLSIDNCTLYYRTKLVPNPTSIHLIGAGQLLCLTPGDSDCDGDLDLADYRAMRPCFGGPTADVIRACFPFDFDFDPKSKMMTKPARVDLQDVAALLRNWGPVPCSTDLDCADDSYCNGVEHCLDGHCISTGNPCFSEACDEALDRCDSECGDKCSSSADCDDGLFCNGFETCADATGCCLPGTAPCLPCDEVGDQCAMTCIASGKTVVGRIDPSGEIEPCTFEALAGSLAVLQLTSAWPFAPCIELYAPSGELERAVCGTQPYNVFIPSHTLMESGLYTIVVRDSDGRDKGDYSLSLLLLPGSLTSVEDADGGDIGSAETALGRIEPRADIDAFRFVGESGRIPLIQLTSDWPFSPCIDLYAPSGAVETQECGTHAYNAFLQGHLLAESGMYTILVRDSDGRDVGNYSLSLLLLPGALTSTPDPDGGDIASAATLAGRIDPRADTDAFRFSAPAGRLAVIQLTSDWPFEPCIELYAPSGVVERGECGSNAYNAFIGDHILQESGSYALVIRDGDGRDTGTYTLSLQLLPGALMSPVDADGGMIASGETKSGNITPRADTDAFQFAGQLGKHALIQLTSAWPFDPCIYLYAPSGALEGLVCGTNAYHAFLQNHVLAESGPYTVLVRDSDGRDTGGYTVSLVILP